jgi:hypothetical protein
MQSRAKELMFLVAYLILFASLFFLALYDFHRGESLVSFGFDPGLTNIFIMTLSFFGVIKTIYHIYRFENE